MTKLTNKQKAMLDEMFAECGGRLKPPLIRGAWGVCRGGRDMCLVGVGSG